MLSVVSESASEGMLFSALCALLRFHTAKTLCGHLEIKTDRNGRSTAAQLRKSFCHRKGIEPTFREGSPRSCAKMGQSEIESRLGRIGVQHEPSR
jgi:hypothetical protein